MATLIKQLRTENPNNIFVAAGDLVGASPLLSSLFHYEPTVESLSLMGLEASAVGNHEFDKAEPNSNDTGWRLSSRRWLPRAASFHRRQIPLSGCKHDRQGNR